MSDPPNTKTLPNVPLDVVKELVKRYKAYIESFDDPSDYHRFMHYARGVADALDLYNSRLVGEIQSAFEAGPAAVADLVDPDKRGDAPVAAYANNFKETPGNPLLAKEYAAGIAAYAASLKETK